MGNVLNFGDFKKKKDNKDEIDVKYDKNEKGPVSPNESYYFFFENVKVAFAGAFVRDLLKNKDKNFDKIVSTINKSSELSKSYLSSQIGEESDEYKILAHIIDHQNKVILDALNYMETPENVDEMFNENSKYLPVIPMLLMIIMSISYTEFDYYQMEKKRFLEISPSIEDLLENNVYKDMSEINSL